ncbi:uncharacterized protein LOC134197456 [Corticium candelabrum]|uniref:uncharacterized protein LOC134197456 n=1 Tax=Corticium candelabrum TaxID=121492 RepID=UPI002E25B61B|nr:uncharacterized protein LOC134197456 [Corticium candelabrum]
MICGRETLLHVCVFLLYWLLHALCLELFRPFGWVPPIFGLLLRWCGDGFVALIAFAVSVRRKRGIYRYTHTFKSFLLPSCLHIIATIAITYIPFRGWKNAAEAPALQLSWIILFTTCLVINFLFYGRQYQRHKLVALMLMLAGYFVSVVSDYEAKFLFLEVVLAYVYGVSYGVMLPMIKQQMETTSLLDAVFLLNFFGFSVLSFAIPLLLSTASWEATSNHKAFSFWTFAILVPIESLYRVLVLYFISISSIEDFFVARTWGFFATTLLATFLYQLDYMISTLKGMVLILLACIIYMMPPYKVLKDGTPSIVN